MVYITDEKTIDMLREVADQFYFTNDDSKIPALFWEHDTGRVRSVCFRKGNKRYFFSDSDGYSVYSYSNGKSKTWQMTKREFERVKKLMISAVGDCDDDIKEKYMSVIGELDYEKGRANAHFSVRPSHENQLEVGTVRFDFRNIYYSFSVSTGIVLKGNVDDPWSSQNSRSVHGIEKKLVLGIMLNSKTVNEKMADIRRGSSK